MSRIKDFYHDEIVQGSRQVIAEPYLFRYFVHFKFNGVTHTILADDFTRILELGKQICPLIQGIRGGPVENELVFLCGDFEIPFLIFESKNPRY
jgi:hypothetical protein